MKRLLSLLSLIFLLTGCALMRPPRPITLNQSIARSVARIAITVDEEERYICTTFAIAPHLFLTAQHCVEDLRVYDFAVLRINGARSLVVKEDAERDLALVLADVDRPPLSFRSTPLTMYEVVYGMGYGYGGRSLFITSHSVMLLNYSVMGGMWPGTIVLNGFIGGMSGGPIYDREGEVVGIIQQASPEGRVGYGVNEKTIREFLDAAPNDIK